MKKINFSAGPSILPQQTLEQTAKAVLDLDGSGLSIMEISHRSKDFKVILSETIDLFKELLDIPSGYSVLLLGGGASLQFCMAPYNLLEKKAAYLDTGTWANRALKEAKLFGDVEVIGSSEDKNYNYIPKDYVIPTNADYLHITTNNTIFGTEIHEDINSPIPLVADMSSDIFSRPIDVSKYAMIYGGAQKNLAPAGVTFVIIKDEILGKVNRKIPTMLDYKVHIEHGTMYNTPPVLPIYAALQTLRWIKDNGGVTSMQKRNIAKAKLLYNEIDTNPMFHGTAKLEDRSLMNVTFLLSSGYEQLEDEFIQFATSKGIVGIKGHRSVGGLRASLYNAMDIEGVQVLVDCMQAFSKKHVK